MSTGVSWWFDLLGIQSNFIVCCFNSGIQTCWELERPRGHMDLFDIQHRNSLLGHTSNIIQHYPLHHDRSFLCMICKYIYTPYHDIMRVYMCTNIYIYIYLYMCTFNSVWPPRRSLHPKLPLASWCGNIKGGGAVREEWPPMVHTWCFTCSTSAPECPVPLPSTRPTWSIYGTVFVHFIYDVLKLEGLIHDFLSSILEGYLNPTEISGFKVDLPLSRHIQKRRNLSTLGSGCKKKVPLYVAPWRCRNVVLRS